MALMDAQENGSSQSVPDDAKNRISEITREVKSKHGGARPGSGPKPKGKPGGSSLGNAGSGSPTKTEEPVSEADLEFVFETAKAGLTLIDKLITGRVYNSVVAIDLKLEPDAQKFSDQVHIDPTEVALVAGACKAIAQKYSFLARYAPEMMIAGWTASYGLRCATVIKEIKALSAAVAAMKGKGNVSDGTHASPSQTS